MLLLYLVAAWLAGIAVSRSADVPWWLWLVLIPPSVIGILIARPKNVEEKHFDWRAVFACGIAFSFGAIRLAMATPTFDKGDLATYNDQGFVTIEGVIVDGPDVRDTHVNLRVRAETLTLDEADSFPVKGLVLVQAPLVATYRYGDPVKITGELHTPPEFEGFSYRDYLARQGVHSMMQYTQVEVTGKRRGNPIRAVLLDFRTTAHRTIMRLLPDPQASLLAGILLGIETGISPEVRDAFNAVGATHVIAISGSNLAILGGLIMSLARRVMRERWAAVVTIVGILTYSIFVGADAAVLRAAIMVTLGLVAAQLGRQTWAFTSIAFAALLMTAINPLTVWDVGFQLSFLATLGLVLYVEPLQNWLAKGLSKLLSAENAQQVIAAISDAFVVTVAAQITTTPIMAYYFGRFSALSLPVNFLIIPAQTPLMVLGGLGVIAALIIWPLGQVLAWGSWVFLSFTLWVVRVFARLPFASLEVGQTAAIWIWAIYGIMFGLTYVAYQPEEKRSMWRERLAQAFNVKAVGFAGLLIAILLFAAAWSMPDGKLHITFIDVGDGTATLIRTPSGRDILVDAGGSGRKLSTALGDSLPFWDRQIDLVILTQPSQTHTGGLLPVLERYHVDAVMTNGVRGDSELNAALWAKLGEQGAQEVLAQPGTRINVGDGVLLTVLHTQAIPLPDGEEGAGEPVVLMLTYGEARVLLTGDLTSESESALLAGAWPLDATVLQVPARGHQDVSSEAFLDVVNPQISVLTVDEGNRYGLPHSETLSRLEALDAPLYRLDQSGSVELITDGRELTIRTTR
jgi:competence protein ComEC